MAAKEEVDNPKENKMPEILPKIWLFNNIKNQVLHQPKRKSTHGSHSRLKLYKNTKNSWKIISSASKTSNSSQDNGSKIEYLASFESKIRLDPSSAKDS